MKGQFEPLVTRQVFNRVQEVLEGNLALCVEPKRDRDEFPLRRFVRCGVCGSTLTASNVKKTAKSTYAYYRCWKNNCKGISVSTEVLEQQFMAYLDELTPHPKLLDLLDAIVIDRYDIRTTEQRMVRKSAEKSLIDMRGYVDRLTSKFVDELIPEEDYRRQRQTAVLRMRELSAVVETEEHDELETQRIMERARRIPATPKIIWKDAGAQRRRQLQKAVFPSGWCTFQTRYLQLPYPPRDSTFYGFAKLWILKWCPRRTKLGTHSGNGCSG